MQERKGRRGRVFPLRLTDEEQRALDALRLASGASSRPLGPWILSRVFGGESPSSFVGTRNGNTPPAAPSSGNTCSSTPRPGSTRTATGRGPGNTGAIAPLERARRVIVDLCAGSGAWSEPYRLAGYDVHRVTFPKHDVRTWQPPVFRQSRIWGVLAAPPCEWFSLARNGHKDAIRERLQKEGFSFDVDALDAFELRRSLSVVHACLALVLRCEPQWWALENPVGLLSRFLGTPRDVFEPCEFGDPWTKRTALWGNFAIPKRGPYVEPKGGGPFCAVCDPSKRKTTWCSRREHRAITAPGFARAFFEANP